MSAVRPRSLRAALAAAAFACGPSAAHEPVPAPPRPPDPPAPACAPVPPGALALLSGETCPWALVEVAGALELQPLAPGADRALAVQPPEECAPCRFTGAMTALGPTLLATRPSPASELAEEAWFGAALGGSAVVFAPLWFDRPALGDSTVLGPPHALAPWACGGALVLWPAPRLPGARGEEPPAALLRAAGEYEAAEGALRRSDRPVPPDMAGCTRIEVEAP